MTLLIQRARQLPMQQIFHNSHEGLGRSRPVSQRGITLILVLIFIVSLSLIAAVGMRNVNTGERTVANERDRALAFQGAESAGREAVAKITAGSFPASGYYTQATKLNRGGNAEYWRTTSSLLAEKDIKDPVVACTPSILNDTARRFDWINCAIVADSDYGNSVNPRYVIEELPDVVVSATVTEKWYRITSRAAGGSNEADVILQIMFTTS